MKKFNKNIGLDNFIIGAALVGGICFLAFQGYLFFSTAQMFVVETTSVVYFALTFTFNFVTVGFLLAHTRDKKSFVEIFERLFLPREILFKPFYFLGISRVESGNCWNNTTRHGGGVLVIDIFYLFCYKPCCNDVF